MEIILHLGTDKTGSTTLQTVLYANRNWLLARSIYLPSTCLGANNGHAMLLKNNEDSSWKEMEEELNEAASKGYERAILSWEGMASFGVDEISSLYRHLRDHDITGLIYLREQADIIQTGHLQQLRQNNNTRTSESMGLSHWGLVNAWKMQSLRFSKRNYYRLLRRWEKSIPGIAFLVRVYDKRRLVNGDVVLDFLNALGLEEDSEFTPTAGPYNKSLDVETGLFIESLQQGNESDADIERLIDLAEFYSSQRAPQARYFLSAETVDRIRQVFRASNRRVAKQFLHSEAELFPTQKDCWTVESLEEVKRRSLELARTIRDLDKTPTLIGVADGEHIPNRVSLVSGWCEPVEWGIWSRGDNSVLEFRVPYRYIKFRQRKFCLILAGQYYGDNTHTSVTVNGKSFGEQALVTGNREMTISSDELDECGMVRIQLSHLAPISPKEYEGKSDPRLLAFGLARVGCILLD